MSGGRRGALVLLLVAASSGCGATLKSPAQGGREWVRVVSDHFAVSTEFDADEARRTTLELERMYSAFRQVAYPHEPRPDFLTEFVLFRDQSALPELGYEAHAGVLLHRVGADLEERLTLATYGSLTGQDRIYIRALFQHELAHRFTAFHFPSAPPWLSEGLSEFFSTMEIESDQIVVGGFLPHRVFADAPWAVVEGIETVFVRIPLDEAPSIPLLQGYSHAQFYGDEASPDPESDAAVKERVKNYAAAWTLVHLLMLGPADYRERFRRYLTALATGALGPREAWDKEFAGTEAALARDYARLLPETTRPIARVPVAALERAQVSLRRLSAGEVHLLWARLRNTDLPEQRRLAREDRDAALRLEPKLVSAHLEKGLNLLEADRLDEAKAAVLVARQLAPDDPRVTQAELMLALDAGDNPSVKAHAMRLMKSANTAAQLSLVAEVLLANKRSLAALATLKKALRMDSACWRCYAVLAQTDLAQDRLAQAIVAQTTAVNLLNEDDPRRGQLLSELDRLIRKAKSAPKAAASTEP